MKKDRKKRRLSRIFTELLILMAPLCRQVSAKLNRGDTVRKKNIVLLIARPLDIDLLLPIHEKVQDRPSLDVSLWVTRKCSSNYPEVAKYLQASTATPIRSVSHGTMLKTARWLMNADCFITTLESTAAKHKLPYIITRLANSLGVATFSMQHGFENVGLTYSDNIHGPDIKFISRKVFTWMEAEKLPEWVPRETKEKVIGVGCTKNWYSYENYPVKHEKGVSVIGIFENLHWHRYGHEYRDTFLSHLEQVSTEYPEFHFILKSHPASVIKRDEKMIARLKNMENVETADMAGRNVKELTTPGLIKSALGIITTPSTIALDGAMADVPVAVTRYGLDLSYYQPLTLLDTLDNWHGFLDALQDDTSRNALKLKSRNFCTEVIIPGDGATRILDYLEGL